MAVPCRAISVSVSASVSALASRADSRWVRRQQDGAPEPSRIKREAGMAHERSALTASMS